MILSYLEQRASAQPHSDFLADSENSISYEAAVHRARCIAGRLKHLGIEPGSNIYLYAEDSIPLVAALLASQYTGANTCVLNRRFSIAELLSAAKILEPGVLITDSDAAAVDWPGVTIPLAELASANVPMTGRPFEGGQIVVLTTGTTGPPKAVKHTWNRLLSQVRLSGEGASRWCLLYPLNHFAGLQVLLHVLKNGHSLAIPPSRRFPDVLETFRTQRIDAASATPTFWRTFAGQLREEEAAGLQLRQITMGGEPATAEILNRLAHLFPSARITHVYATTEIGSCFAVSDGRPGFPERYLDTPPGKVQFRITGGELYVRPYGEEINEGDWMATGDLVEVHEDRVLFLGRKGEVINVGGVKVFPPIVEEPIRTVEGVQNVRVYGRPNPVTGQIVAAEIELAQTASETAVVQAVRDICRARLSRYEQPRDIRIVGALARSNEKIIRKCNDEQ
jgi:acyl-CoA synthetase (AMP-forming)/AMP-acid ligase II